MTKEPGPKYSMNFEGANRLKVTLTDYRVEASARESKINVISDQSVISRVVQLLGELPKDGILQISRAPGAVYNVVAYLQEQPLAQVTFYDGALQLENSAFGFESELDQAKEAELHKLLIRKDVD